MAMSATSFGLGEFGSPPPFGQFRVAGTTVTGTGSVRRLDVTWAEPKPIKTNCKNCGAAFNRWDDDCNYCGTIRP